MTSDRRSGDLIDALERRGATVMHAPALKIAPVAADLPLVEDTQQIIAARPDYAVITTALGRPLRTNSDSLPGVVRSMA